MNFNAAVFVLATAVAATAAAPQIHVTVNKGTIFDLLPLVSQIKALGHLALGDSEGYDRTNENFVKHGLVMSQGRSAVMAARGDFDKALDEQATFFRLAGETLENTPIVGDLTSFARFLLDKAFVSPISQLGSKLFSGGSNTVVTGIQGFLQDAIRHNETAVNVTEYTFSSRDNAAANRNKVAAAAAAADRNKAAADLNGIDQNGIDQNGAERIVQI